MLSSYLGTGTQACYRGTRLYDPSCPASKALVGKWVSWFKEHRTILNSDLVHLRRPDLAGKPHRAIVDDGLAHAPADLEAFDIGHICVPWV